MQKYLDTESPNLPVLRMHFSNIHLFIVPEQLFTAENVIRVELFWENAAIFPV